MDSKKPDLVEEPEASYGKYSYADYLTWQFEEVVELINGKIFKKAAAAPKRLHQKVSSKLNFKLYQFLEGKRCQVYAAPFDVRFPKDSKEDRQIFNVVQPDLCVICDKSKIVTQGIIGAPDLVIEILSPSNRQIEMHEKFEAYQASLVREYWIIHPGEQWMLQYALSENNLFVLHKKHENLSQLASVIFPGLSVDVAAYKP